MIKEHEELFQKELPDIVEKLISEGSDVMEYEALKRVVQKRRDKTRVVTFKTTKGTAV